MYIRKYITTDQTRKIKQKLYIIYNKNIYNKKLYIRKLEFYNSRMILLILSRHKTKRSP